MKRFLVDTHVHIYPCYRVDVAIDSLMNKMDDSAGDVARVACLTERFDCFLFERLAASDSQTVYNRFVVRRLSDTVLQLRRLEDSRELYLVAGQQIVTAENIEILALNVLSRTDDGRDAAQTVSSVRERGGVPVAAWAPGKWFGERGRVVTRLFDRFGPGDLALGDTTLRPIGWATPVIMRDARRRGFRIIAGSDPLPYAGEESRPGSYYCDIRGADVSAEQLVARLLEIPRGSISVAGRRGDPGTVALRLVRHKLASKKTLS